MFPVLLFVLLVLVLLLALLANFPAAADALGVLMQKAFAVLRLQRFVLPLLLFEGELAAADGPEISALNEPREDLLVVQERQRVDGRRHCRASVAEPQFVNETKGASCRMYYVLLKRE
jgi:hypothetical protein